MIARASAKVRLAFGCWSKNVSGRNLTGWLMVRGSAGDVSRRFEDDSKTANSDRESAEEGTFAMRLHIKAAAAVEALQVEQALASLGGRWNGEQRGDSVVWAHAAL